VKRLQSALSVPKSGTVALTSWTLESIFAARDDQMLGHFYRPARMADAMRTDDALAVAFENRLAPQRCIKVEIVPARGSRGAAIAAEAEALFGSKGVGLSPETLSSIHGCLVDHDVAFAQAIPTPREDGSRVDYELHYWPIEHVRWDPVQRCFVTRVDPESADAFEVPIVHGDGRWVVFQRYEHEPFKHGTILASALIWARHAYAVRDWAKGSVAHGSAKVVGKMADGVPIYDSENGLSSEATALAELVRAIASSDQPAGLLPAGASVDFLTNTSTAWQVWAELVSNAEKAAARVYLGTDGMLGAQGGAPGVDVQALFGVAATKVQGDLAAIERALQTGLIEPWCAINFGDSSLAPTRRYLLPDADADAARAALATRKQAFFSEVEKTRANGFAVTQEYVDALAREHGVEPPRLPPVASTGPSIALAPTDLARVVSVNEARASAGLGPLLDIVGAIDPDGRLTVEEYAAKKSAAAVTPPAVPTPAAPSPQALAEHRAKMTAALIADVREAKDAGLSFSQDQIAALALRYGVPCPKIEVAE